tara:strand:+ start:1442 stop:1915 length:474 start_codon:yes stop_codon:yes gene_type:complete
MKNKRRIKGNTDYKARINLLKSGKARIVFRKTNKYIIGQYIKSKEAKDSVVLGVTSKNLLEYGWPESKLGSLKSLTASYLTGFLLGNKILKTDEVEGIFDLGLLRSIAKSRPYAFLKGVFDSGVKIKVEGKMFPDEEKLKKENVDFDKIKENISGEK